MKYKLYKQNSVGYLPIGTDETCQANNSTIGEELCYLRDTPDILLPVIRTETEILVETVPDVVAIEAV